MGLAMPLHVNVTSISFAQYEENLLFYFRCRGGVRGGYGGMRSGRDDPGGFGGGRTSGDQSFFSGQGMDFSNNVQGERI